MLLARELGEWIGVSLFLATSTFLVLRYYYDSAERGDPGYTTEIASLCTFAVGALAQSGQLLVATVVTIVMVALLRSKRALHRAGELLSPADMEVLIRFLVITGIVLPLLPDEPIDPFYGVLRPRDVWWMVVRISALSFLGYALMRVRPGGANHVINGLLGGLVSSTATTVAYARAHQGPERSRPLEALVVLAVSASFVRTAVLVLTVSPALALRVAAPLAGLVLAGSVLGFVVHRPAIETRPSLAYDNPLGLRVALTFAALYAAVLLLIAAAEEVFAEGGLLALSALAAIPGADAPSLSVARLATDGTLALDLAARGVLVVAAASTLAKAGILLALGHRARHLLVTLVLLAAVAAGLARFAV